MASQGILRHSARIVQEALCGPQVPLFWFTLTVRTVPSANVLNRRCCVVFVSNVPHGSRFANAFLFFYMVQSLQQHVYNTGIVFFHRFYAMQSFANSKLNRWYVPIPVWCHLLPRRKNLGLTTHEPRLDNARTSAAERKLPLPPHHPNRTACALCRSQCERAIPIPVRAPQLRFGNASYFSIVASCAGSCRPAGCRSSF
jgi:hypothetical protein